MPQLLADHAQTIFREMMSHPVLFTHPHPKKIALIGDEDNSILLEVLKHPNVLEVHTIQKRAALMSDNPRVEYHHDEMPTWIKNQKQSSLDILILAADSPPALSESYYSLLHDDGILLQQSESLFDAEKLRSLMRHLKTIGFSDLQILHFPQPNDAYFWRSAVMALKTGIFKRVREKSIFNKSFDTQFYNFDMHNAAIALPEFIKTSLEQPNSEDL